MGTDLSEWVAHPLGEQPEVEEWSTVADTFAGRVHIEWDTTAPVTPLGQLPFFIEYLKQGGLFDGWVADCPLSFTSPNAPRKRDVLGTLLLSVLAGHRRYAHVTALRCDAVNPPLLGMSKVVSEDALRRALAKIDETAGVQWLQAHLDYCVRPMVQGGAGNDGWFCCAASSIARWRCWIAPIPGSRCSVLPRFSAASGRSGNMPPW